MRCHIRTNDAASDKKLHTFLSTLGLIVNPIVVTRITCPVIETTRDYIVDLNENDLLYVRLAFVTEMVT